MKTEIHDNQQLIPSETSTKKATLEQQQLLDSLKAMPNGVRLGVAKSNRKRISDTPLFGETMNGKQADLF